MGKKKRIVLLFFTVVFFAGLALAGWYVDRMALAFLTGQRRVPGKDWFGQSVRMEGPPPGYLFLGFSKPAADSPGFEIVRPADAGVKAGLRAGDEVVSVDGITYESSFDLISALLANHTAGESVVVNIRRGADEFQKDLQLETFFRTPADLDLEYEDFELESRSGFKLRGWFIPSALGRDDKAVIFVHGANSSRFQALDGAPFWHRRGYGLLAMDLSGRGESEGDYITFTLNEREDVRSMVDALQNRLGISPERVVLFGSSNGAASVIYASAETLDVAGLVLDAPYSDLWAEGTEMLSTRGVPPRLLHLLSWAVWFRAGLDLGAIRPIDVIERFPGSVLFIHGDADSQVLPYHSEQLHQRRLDAGLPSKRWLIEGGEHGFDNYPPEEEFWNQVIDFCDLHLNEK